MEDDEKQGIRKKYRSRDEVIKFRKENKRKLSKTGWFKQRGYQGVFRCENTPRGILAKRIRERLDSDPDLRALRILVQEKNGIPLSQLTNYADPEARDFCGRKDCFVCETSRDPVKGRCWQEGIVYKITCLRCKDLGFEALYHGESGFSSYLRGKQHIEGMRSRTQGNVLYEHSREFHNGAAMEMKDFLMEIVDRYQRPVVRLSREGLQISHSLADMKNRAKKTILMNS